MAQGWWNSRRRGQSWRTSSGMSGYRRPVGEFSQALCLYSRSSRGRLPNHTLTDPSHGMVDVELKRTEAATPLSWQCWWWGWPSLSFKTQNVEAPERWGHFWWHSEVLQDVPKGRKVCRIKGCFEIRKSNEEMLGLQKILWPSQQRAWERRCGRLGRKHRRKSTSEENTGGQLGINSRVTALRLLQISLSAFFFFSLPAQHDDASGPVFWGWGVHGWGLRLWCPKNVNALTSSRSYSSVENKETDSSK